MTRRKVVWISLAAVVMTVLLGLRIWVYPYSATGISHRGELFPTLGSPSASHLFGTTSIGQDIFVRTMDGLLVAASVIVLGGLAALGLGVILNFLAFAGGRILDRLIGYFSDALYSIPSLLIALSVLLGLPADAEYRLLIVMASVVTAVGLFFGAKIFRTLRMNIAREQKSGYYIAAKANGLGKIRLFWLHLLPNSLAGIRPLVTGAASDAILTLAGLGFVGVGISATDGSDWGYDLSRGVSDLSQGIWWTTLFPGLAISLTVLAFSLVSERRSQDDQPWRRKSHLRD